MSKLKWPFACLIILVFGCTSIHSLKRHPDKNCQELYLMFQDTAHWKYDAAKKIYITSDELDYQLNKDGAWQKGARSSCFEFLAEKKIVKILGTPTYIVKKPNPTVAHRMVHYKLNLNAGDIRSGHNTKMLRFHFDKEGQLLREGLMWWRAVSSL